MKLDGSGIPVKCRMRQKYDKRVGKVKVLSPAAILKYINRIEKLRMERASVKPQQTLEMARHCGPNFRKDYNI